MNNFKAPWIYRFEDSTIYDSDGEIVCDTMSTGEQWEEDNAHLIACAPEMYSKLESLAEFTAILDAHTHASIELDLSVSEINSLLAKARGEA